MVKKANMVKRAKPGNGDCGCAFLIDENGIPTVECPTNESQALAFAALQKNPDVSIRVAASVISAVEEADEGQIEESDFEDDFEFDDDDADLEEEADDDPLPF